MPRNFGFFVMFLCAVGVVVSYVRTRILIGKARKNAEEERIAQISRSDLITRSCLVVVGTAALILWP